jgi:hypothetical protein
MLKLQVRRGGTWRAVGEAASLAVALGEANAVYRAARRRRAVRVVRPDGTQELYLRAATGR